jgi:hypothetical protein
MKPVVADTAYYLALLPTVGRYHDSRIGVVYVNRATLDSNQWPLPTG